VNGDVGAKVERKRILPLGRALAKVTLLPTIHALGGTLGVGGDPEYRVWIRE